MRALTRLVCASLAVIASLSLAAQTALADELLVMPYACTMVGGRPLLTRAPEESHRIVGGREQRTHTACSPSDPQRCQNWTVHRFDLDCEGTRVPWVSVVASVAEETNRRAWLEDGRLIVRMPPSWSFDPDDPCARGPGYDDRFGFGRMRRYCADRRAMAPPPAVAMPAGFAPMLGIDGYFVRSAGPGNNASPPLAVAPPAPTAKSAARAERPEILRSDAPQQPAARTEPLPEPIAKEPPARPAPPPKVAVQTQPAAPAEPPPPPAVKPSPAPHAAPPTATPGGPVVPKIINRPEAATTDVPEQMRPVPTVPKAETPTADLSKPKTGAPASKDQPPLPSKNATGGNGQNQTVTVSLLSVVRSPMTGIVALGGLALVMLAAFALARRREHLATTQARDIASVSLQGRGNRGQLVTQPAGNRTPSTPASPPPPPAPQPTTRGHAPAWAERIPQTRGEALQMLGMGVSPDATEMAMKKIVDGLRQSWHPDFAKDEADRQLREFRLKQINAAWELIQGKRLERLDS